MQAGVDFAGDSLPGGGGIGWRKDGLDEEGVTTIQGFVEGGTEGAPGVIPHPSLAQRLGNPYVVPRGHL